MYTRGVVFYLRYYLPRLLPMTDLIFCRFQFLTSFLFPFIANHESLYLASLYKALDKTTAPRAISWLEANSAGL